MLKKSTYKPRYSIANTIRSKINIYKNGYHRRFYERRSRRVKRGGLFRHYILVAKNRKWTRARRFIAPKRRLISRRVRKAGSTIYGRPEKRLYKYAFNRKQALRHFYGLGFAGKEKRITSLFKSTRRIQGLSNETFFSRLESRLDRALFRRRIFPTIYGCRQFIQHYGVHLNNLNLNKAVSTLPNTIINTNANISSSKQLTKQLNSDSFANLTNELIEGTRVEHSTQYEVQIGDTISVPDYIWPVLYYTLLERPYYRRWGTFLKLRRFYSQFKKKIFRARVAITRRTRPSYRKIGQSKFNTRTRRFNYFARLKTSSQLQGNRNTKNALTSSKTAKASKSSKEYSRAVSPISSKRSKGSAKVINNKPNKPNKPNTMNKKNKFIINNKIKKSKIFVNKFKRSKAKSKFSVRRTVYSRPIFRTKAAKQKKWGGFNSFSNFKRFKPFKGFKSFKPFKPFKRFGRKNKQKNYRNGIRKRGRHLYSQKQITTKNSRFDFYNHSSKRRGYLISKPENFSTEQTVFWYKFKSLKGGLTYTRSPRYLWTAYIKTSRIRRKILTIRSNWLKQKNNVTTLKTKKRVSNISPINHISSNKTIKPKANNVSKVKLFELTKKRAKFNRIRKSIYDFAGHSKLRRSYFLLSAFSAYARRSPLKKSRFIGNTHEQTTNNHTAIPVTSLIEPIEPLFDSKNQTEDDFDLANLSLELNASSVKVFRALKSWKYSRTIRRAKKYNKYTPSSASTKNALFKSVSAILQQRKTTPEANKIFRESTGVTQKRRSILTPRTSRNKKNSYSLTNVSTDKKIAFVKDLRDVLRALPWREKSLAVRKQRKLFAFFYTQKLRKTFLPTYTKPKKKKGKKKANWVAGFKGTKAFKAFTKRKEKLKALYLKKVKNKAKANRPVLSSTSVKHKKGAYSLKSQGSANSANSVKKSKKSKKFKNTPINKFNFVRNRSNFKKHKGTPFFKKRDYIKRQRRRLLRFIRRWRRRLRRTRRFPRRKSVHRHFPAYLQRDLRTLRCTKISAASSKQIYTSYRSTPQKIFAFYKSRGY